MSKFSCDFLDKDNYENGRDSLLYIETIFTFFSMLDPRRISEIDGESLCLTFESMSEIGRAFTSSALSCLDRIETANKLAAQKGGEQ